MIKEAFDIVHKSPGFWLFLCVIVIVGGQAFVIRISDRLWPPQINIDQTEFGEQQSSGLKIVIRNQRYLSRALKRIEGALKDQTSQLNAFDQRITALEAWQELPYEKHLDVHPE